MQVEDPERPVPRVEEKQRAKRGGSHDPKRDERTRAARGRKKRWHAGEATKGMALDNTRSPVDVDRVKILAVSRALEDRRNRMEADVREVQQLAKAAHASSSALQSGEVDSATASRWLFARAHAVGKRFASRVDRGDASMALRKAMSEELQRAIKKLSMQHLFTSQYVTKACRRADGLQPHLVAPEKGMRNIIMDALTMVHGPARACVDSVKVTLQYAAATAVADVLGTAGAAVANNPMQQSAQKQVEQYAKETAETVRNLVEMEAEYPTASFFQQRIAMRAPTGQISAGSEEVITFQSLQESDNEDEDRENEAEERHSSARKRTKEEQQELPDHPATALQGYLEKMSSHPPHLWQKRYFLLSESRKKLFYFKSPDELPHYRGIINLSNCVVQEVSHDGHGEKSRENLPTGAAVSLLFSIAHQDVSKAVSKERNNILLRADNAATKFEWMARLRALTTPDPAEAYLMSAMPSTVQGENARTPEPKKRGKGKNSPAQYVKQPALIGSMYDLTLADSNTEARMGQLGADMAEYVWNACKRLGTTIPKAIVHCLIEPSKANLVDSINAAIVDLPMEHVQAMSQNVVADSPRKNAAQSALERLKTAQTIVKQKLMSPGEDGKVSLPGWVIDLADLPSGASDDDSSPVKSISFEDSTEHLRNTEGGLALTPPSVSLVDSSARDKAPAKHVPLEAPKAMKDTGPAKVKPLQQSRVESGSVARVGREFRKGASSPAEPLATSQETTEKKSYAETTAAAGGRSSRQVEPRTNAPLSRNGVGGSGAGPVQTSGSAVAQQTVRSTPPRRRAPAPPQTHSDHLLDL